MTTPFNLVRDEPDDRDHRFDPVDAMAAAEPVLAAAESRLAGPEARASGPELAAAAAAAPPSPPSVVSLDPATTLPPAYDQGKLNSCTANAAAAAVYYGMVKQRLPRPFDPSRLFIYYNERALAHAIHMESYPKHGAPATLRQCLKTLNKTGYCENTLWPYDESRFDDPPPKDAYREAESHRAHQYQRLDHDLDHLRACLASGHPFLFGVDLYSSYRAEAVKRTGEVPLPDFDRERMIGGHAILAVGYDDRAGRILFRNSVGAGWGEDGYGTLPYEYVLDKRHAFDFWVIYKLTGAGDSTPSGS